MAGGVSFPPRSSPSQSRWVGNPSILPASNIPQWARYLVLTISFLGLQLVWSCEMAQASPYLLSLGVSKSMMSVVFLAGPLSGLIVQPVVGVMSDGCKSSLGRRKPFIIGGCAVTATAVLLLGFSGNLAGVVFAEGGVAHNRLTIGFAVIAVYVIDFSLNVVQAMDRSLLVDVIAPNLQPDANAWASRMFGFGACFAFWVGGLDLVNITNGWMGDTQLKVLAIFTAVFLCLCHGVTVFCVKERVLVSRGDENVHGLNAVQSMLHSLGEIWVTLRTLPRPIQQVLNVQFASWVGWFPVLFFATTWVAEIYASAHFGSSDLAAATPSGRESATRAGTRAMLFHSIIAFLTSIVLPPFIASDAQTPDANTNRFSSTHRRGMGWGQVQDKAMDWLPTLPLPWLSLSLLWTVSNAFFSFLLLSTFFASQVWQASLIIAAAGFCWAITNWAPFALLGDLILRMGTDQRERSPIALAPTAWNGGPTLSPIREEREVTDAEHEEFADLLGRKKRSNSNRSDGLGEAWSPSEKGDANSVPGDPISRPTTPDTAFFDASAETPRRELYSPSTSARSPSSPSRARSPPERALAVSPDQARQPRTRESSHPYGSARVDYPANNSNGAFDAYGSARSLEYGDDPYAYKSGSNLELELTPKVLQIRHSDEFSYTNEDRQSFERSDPEHSPVVGLGFGPGAEDRGMPRITVGGEDGEEWDVEAELEDGDSGGDKTGVILGCHNIYLVLPQFLVSAMASIIFALFAPSHTVLAGHPAAVPHTNTTDTALSSDALAQALSDIVRKAAEVVVEDEGGGWDALGLIFRIGGVSAAVSAWICWRMTRDRERERAARRRGQ